MLQIGEKPREEPTCVLKVHTVNHCRMPIPWDSSLVADTYDARALLSESPKWPPPPTKSATKEEKDLENMLNFERYRDLIEATKKSLDVVHVLKSAKESVLNDKNFAPTQRDLPTLKPKNQ
jgi:hypothetical protein